MKIVGVILCMILQIKAQKSNQLAPETSHDPSEYQKGTVANKTHSQGLLKYQKRAITNEIEFFTEDIHQQTEYQRETVTNVTESHDFFSIIRFLPNLIPNIVKTRHWISPHSFGYGLKDNISDKVEHGYSDLAISTNKIRNELATETSLDSSEYQNGAELSTATFHEGRVSNKSHPFFFIFRFLLHSFINLLSPRRWISSGSTDMKSNKSDEATTHQNVFKIQDRKVANEVNPPHVEKSQRSDQTGVRLRKFHMWYLSNPRLLLSQPKTGWLSENETTRTTLAGSYGFLIKIKKRSNKHFHQFSHDKWIFWKSILCFIFKVMVYCLAIMGLLLLLHNLFSTKKNTEPIKRKKSNKVGYYLVV